MEKLFIKHCICRYDYENRLVLSYITTFSRQKGCTIVFLKIQVCKKGFLKKENNIDLFEIAQQLYQLNKLAFLKFEVCIV